MLKPFADTVRALTRTVTQSTPSWTCGVFMTIRMDFAGISYLSKHALELSVYNFAHHALHVVHPTPITADDTVFNVRAPTHNGMHDGCCCLLVCHTFASVAHKIGVFLQANRNSVFSNVPAGECNCWLLLIVLLVLLVTDHFNVFFLKYPSISITPSHTM